jgi:hypothetical protein
MLHCSSQMNFVALHNDETVTGAARQFGPGNPLFTLAQPSQCDGRGIQGFA